MKSGGARPMTSTAAAPARAAAPAAPARAKDPTGMLAVQRAVGNRAARALLGKARRPPAAAPAPADDAGAAFAGDLADGEASAAAPPATAITLAARPGPFEITAGAPSAEDDAADPALARVRVAMLADEVRDSGARASAAVATARRTGELGLGRRADHATARIATEIEHGVETAAAMFGAERAAWTAGFARGEAGIAASSVLYQGLAWARGAIALVGMSVSVKDARDKVETAITDSIDRIAAIREAQQNHVHDRTLAITRSARELGERKAASYHDGDVALRYTKRAAVSDLASQFADGVTAKEAEAKQSVAEGLAALPGGFRSEGDKVKAELADPTPKLAPAIADSARTTGELIRDQAAAGRAALNEFAKSALAALASGEAAVRGALEQLRTAATEQVRRAARAGREALGQTARRMTAELAGASADAAQALLGQDRPSVARSRQFVGWVKQQHELGAQRFADAMPAAVAQLARPLSGIVRTTGARVRGSAKQLAGWLTAQRTSVDQQRDASLAHIDASLAAIVAGFADLLADTQRQITAKLAEATGEIDQKFKTATDSAEREVSGKIDEAYDQVEAGLPELASKMDDTVEQIDWDDRHPVLSTLRDIGLFIAGEIWGLLKLAFKLVAALVVALIAIVGLVIAGLSLAVAAAVVAIAAVVLLVTQIGIATYHRYREAQAAGDDRGFWANLGLGFSDVAGLTKIYHAFTAKGLTPFERGEGYIDGVGDLAGVVMTVAGARVQIKEIKLAPSEPIPYADGAALEGAQGLGKIGRALRIQQGKVADGGMPRIERARAIWEGLTEAGGGALDRVRSWSRSGGAGKPAAGTEPVSIAKPAATAETTAPPAAAAETTAPPAAAAEATAKPAEATAKPAETTAATAETPAKPAAAEAMAKPAAPAEAPAIPAAAAEPAATSAPGSEPAATAELPAADGRPAAAPGRTIFEPFVGDSLASPTDLMARNPGSTVTASEATLMPSAEQIATFQARGGRFLTDRFGESLPANSVDELHVRYPLPHQKSTELALHLTPEELANPLAAVQARMAAIESLHNLAPEALRTLQPEGTLEVIFAEKEIVSEIDGVKQLRWTDPETGTVYRFEVVSAPRMIPRAEAGAPYSGLGIPKTTTEVYIAQLRKAAVPETAARSIPEGGAGLQSPKLAPDAPTAPAAAHDAIGDVPASDHAAPATNVEPAKPAAPSAKAPSATAPGTAAPSAKAPGAKVESAQERLMAMRKRAAEERARAEAERLAQRSPEQELAATEYRSDAAHLSKSEGARFGVDQATVTAAGDAYRATYEQRFLEARRNGLPAKQARETAHAAAVTRMNDVILNKAKADAPGRALADALADTRRRGVPDAFAADDAIQQQNFRDIAPDAHGHSSRGQAAREISPELVGKTVSEMEQLASARGGVRTPATGVEDVRTNRVDDLGAPRLNPDGSPESYAQITYDFADGTRVRIKPGGDKINSTGPMYSVELVHPDAPRPGPPQESVAFKYDPQGHPVPKGPGDIRNPYPANTAPHKAYQDALLQAGHLEAHPGKPPPAAESASRQAPIATDED